jgi:hypothetical protein
MNELDPEITWVLNLCGAFLVLLSCSMYSGNPWIYNKVTAGFP